MKQSISAVLQFTHKTQNIFYHFSKPSLLAGDYQAEFFGFFP